jgi:transglutaminase-like putative cysteine protease
MPQRFAASIIALTSAAFMAGACFDLPDSRALAIEYPPRGVVTSNTKVFTVRMDTSVRIPEKGPHCNQVRVWHALPTHRPWSGVLSPGGATDQRYNPVAIIEAEKDKRSTHIYWATRGGLTPNRQLHYISSFKVVSPDRVFDTDSYRVTWSDISSYNSQNKITFKKPRTDIAALANKINYNLTPTDTVKAYCKWIRENLSYDATVPYPGDDTASILAYRSGHCMHFLSIFDQLCGVSGLLTRQAKGLNLASPSGNSAVATSRTDYTNAHVWGEVYLPQVGWVEVEPSGGDKCFNIPATYVQNNSDFQNYAVWLDEEGQKPRMPNWTLHGTIFTNDYGVDHKITFSESSQ